MTNPYKTKIVKVTDIKPVQGDDFTVGTFVQELKEKKPAGPYMRVVMISGLDVLVNYREE